MQPDALEQLGVYVLAVLLDDEPGNVLGEIAYAFQVGVYLEHCQGEAQVDGNRVVQHQEVLYVTVQFQFAGVHPLLPYQHIPRLLLLRGGYGLAHVSHLVVDKSPHVQYLLAYLYEFFVYKFYHSFSL